MSRPLRASFVVLFGLAATGASCPQQPQPRLITFKTANGIYLSTDGAQGRDLRADHDVNTELARFDLGLAPGTSISNGQILRLRAFNGQFVNSGFGDAEGQLRTLALTGADRGTTFAISKRDGQGEIRGGDSVTLRAENDRWIEVQADGLVRATANNENPAAIFTVEFWPGRFTDDDLASRTLSMNDGTATASPDGDPVACNTFIEERSGDEVTAHLSCLGIGLPYVVPGRGRRGFVFAGMTGETRPEFFKGLTLVNGWHVFKVSEPASGLTNFGTGTVHKMTALPALGTDSAFAVGQLFANPSGIAEHAVTVTIRGPKGRPFK